MNHFPTELEKIIHTYLKQTYLAGRFESKKGTSFNDQDIRFFSKGTSRLSEAFTSERGSLPKNYFNDPVLRSGYLFYFLPVNILKITSVLNELYPTELTTGKIRVLDLGSGPGTSVLGTMAFYAQMLQSKKIKDAWLDFTLIDQNFSILKDAKNLHDAYKNELEEKVKGFNSMISVKNYDLTRGALKRFLRSFRFHLIIVSNLLNEWNDLKNKVSFIQALMEDQLEKNGKLIIIEPALQKTSRDLQLVRDEILALNREHHVWAPCLHQEGCPLNVVNQRDWCHFYLPWRAPIFIEKADRLLGLNKQWLNCSYLILSKKPRESQKLFSNPQSTWRVISNPLPSKGKRELILCGPPGRYHLNRQDKDRSRLNIALDEMRRGDLVEVDVKRDGFDVDGNFCLDKQTHVKIIKKQ